MRTRSTLRALLPLLAGAVLFVLLLALGNWQRGRAHEKEALQADLDALAQSAPLTVGARADAAALRPGQPLRASGQWQAGADLYIDNRTHEGRAGYHLLTPLQLADGSGTVLVNRGWLAAPADRSLRPRVAAAVGAVEVEGRPQRPQTDGFTLASAREVVVGELWQVLDLQRYARLHAIDICKPSSASPCLAGWVLLQTSAAADGLVRDWPLPGAGVGRHRAYALQWYALAALVFVLVAAYLRHLLRRNHDARQPRLAGY